MEQIRVAVGASDPITLAGLTNYFESRRDAVVVSSSSPREEVDVVVAALDRLTSETVGTLRAMDRRIAKPIVLVIDEITEAELLTAADCRVMAILPRAAVTDERLADSVRGAAADVPDISPDRRGQLVEHAERLRRGMLPPDRLTASSLSEREITVLRLMADGLVTNEIAQNLSYSQRTVTNIIYEITSRLRLRNRSHAVAYAMRSGVI